MKAKIILYGWILSLVPMTAGLGTIEWALETGEPILLQGLALFLIWILFSLLTIRNKRIVDQEMKQFERWFDKTFTNNTKPE